MRNWNDPVCAPKDGTMLLLLIRQGQDEDDAFTPFEDSREPYETIGFNSVANTGEDRWDFAGWDWQKDCFVTGAGEVVGWLPFGAHPVAQEEGRLTEELSIAGAVAPCRAEVVAVLRELVESIDEKHGWHVRAILRDALTAVDTPPPAEWGAGALLPAEQDQTKRASGDIDV